MAKINLFNKNYLECDDVKFDLIFTDIPYNIGKDAYASNPRWWNNGDYKNGKSEKADSMFFETDANFNIYEWIDWCYNHLKDDGKVISFVSIQQLSALIMDHRKFKKYTPLIFIKNNSSEVLKANMRIVNACEYGIILYKNKLGYFNNNGKMIKNYFNFKNETHKIHPNQKPIDLCKQILQLYTDADSLVCDCCMGSGNILKACKELNINCYGFEIDSCMFEKAKLNIGD